jgi:2,5-furandicarboxylate decarboxylase 1
VIDESELVKQMTELLREAPRTWYEILEHFAGQPYRPLYRAFGQIRGKRGRREDLSPTYPYTFTAQDSAGDGATGS